MARHRTTRVYITYGEADSERELPFVVGVLGDFSGQPAEKLKDLDKRNFVYIDRDSFDTVMVKMTPGLELMVPNTLSSQGGELKFALKFDSLKDFEPAQVA